MTIKSDEGNVLILALFAAMSISVALVFFVQGKESNMSVFDSYVTMNEQAMEASSWSPFWKMDLQPSIPNFNDSDRVTMGIYQTEWSPWWIGAYSAPPNLYLGQRLFGTDPFGANSLVGLVGYGLNYAKTDSRIVRSCSMNKLSKCLRFGLGPGDASPGRFLRSNFYERIYDDDGNISYFINDIYTLTWASSPAVSFMQLVMPLLKPFFQMIRDPLNYNGYVSGGVKCKYLYKYFTGALVYNPYPNKGSCGLIISPVLNGVSDPIVGQSSLNLYVRRYAIFQENSPSGSRRSGARPYIMGILFFFPSGSSSLTGGVDTMVLFDVTVASLLSSYLSPHIQVRCYTYGGSVPGCEPFLTTEVSDFFKSIMDKLRTNYYT